MEDMKGNWTFTPTSGTNEVVLFLPPLSSLRGVQLKQKVQTRIRKISI
jgi:hypothetical protein